MVKENTFFKSTVRLTIGKPMKAMLCFVCLLFVTLLYVHSCDTATFYALRGPNSALRVAIDEQTRSALAPFQDLSQHDCPLLVQNEKRYQLAVGARESQVKTLDDLWVMLRKTAEAWDCGDLSGTDYSNGGDPKWICGFATIKNRPCVVYSFGSNGNIAFEEGIRSRHSMCSVDTFDPTMNAQYHFRGHYSYVGANELPDAMNFHQVGLGGFDGMVTGHTGAKPFEMYVATLSTIMSKLKHHYLDVLKIDIEGSEWGFLDNFFDQWPVGSSVTVGNLLLEVHLSQKLAFGRKINDVVRVQTELEARGYRLVHVAVIPGNLDMAELSYTHKNYARDEKPHPGC